MFKSSLKVRLYFVQACTESRHFLTLGKKNTLFYLKILFNHLLALQLKTKNKNLQMSFTKQAKYGRVSNSFMDIW